MESRIGHDFSKVKIHTGEPAARSARALGALAYTVGDSIVFSSSSYAPQSTEGRRLLAHELAHVVQQSAAPAPHAQSNLKKIPKVKPVGAEFHAVNDTGLGCTTNIDFKFARSGLTKLSACNHAEMN
jgi:hypothetical protein